MQPSILEAVSGLSAAGTQIVLLGSKMGSIGDGRTGGGLVRNLPAAGRRLERQAVVDQHVAPVRMQGAYGFGRTT